MAQPPDTESSGLYRRWVSTWQCEVALSRAAVGLADLTSMRLLELSANAAELFGVTPEQARGLDYLTVAEHPREAAMSFHLASEGLIDDLRGRRRYQTRDGRVLERRSYGRTIRCANGPHLGVFVVAGTESERDPAVLGDQRSDGPSLPVAEDRETTRVTVEIVGDRFRITRAEAQGTSRTGRDVVGVPIGDLVHPDDTGALLLTLARATTAAQAAAYLRWQSLDSAWERVMLEVMMSQGAGGPTFDITVLREPSGSTPRLLGATGIPGLRELPVRQQEVLVRLTRGERVRQIANEMYLSESTVRNHLVAIFRRAGVHSQQELLTSLLKAAHAGKDAQ